MSSEPHEGWERIEHEDIDTDSETYTIPPEIDIDQCVEDWYFRIEKLGTDGLWVSAYTGARRARPSLYNTSCGQRTP
jgi:hypothetical protein